MSNEMATKKVTDIATDAPMDFFGDKTGFEGVDRDCVQTPFLKLAQSATDETKEMNALYIPGLKPGMFFCPSTKQIYGSDINLVLVHFDRMYVIYEGTGKESKYQGSITSMEYDRDIAPTAVREKSYTLLNGLRYVDTRSFLVIPYDRPYDGAMMFSMSSTGITPSKKLITQAMNVKAMKNGEMVDAPMWSSVWNLKSEYYSDPKGDYFQIAGINRMGWVNAKIAPKVKQLFEEMQGIRVAPAGDGEAHVTAVDPVNMARQAAGGENEIF